MPQADADSERVQAESFLQVQACRPARRVNCFFHYKPLTPENIHAMAHVSRLGMSIESDRLCH
jgi:hypothetical protein